MASSFKATSASVRQRSGASENPRPASKRRVRFMALAPASLVESSVREETLIKEAIKMMGGDPKMGPPSSRAERVLSAGTPSSLFSARTPAPTDPDTSAHTAAAPGTSAPTAAAPGTSAPTDPGTSASTAAGS